MHRTGCLSQHRAGRQITDSVNVTINGVEERPGMTTETGASPSEGAPEHLIWRLGHFENHNRAIRFAKQFQETLCVFSGPVQQLYTNYDISVPEQDDRSLVILPNPYAYHDTFNGITEEAVIPTGLSIVPGDLYGKEGLFLVLPLVKDGKKTSRPVPLKVGLLTMFRHETAKMPFLPVITKGDLRAFRKDSPSLHLHRIIPGRLSDRSEMEVRGIQRVIREKLEFYL